MSIESSEEWKVVRTMIKAKSHSRYIEPEMKPWMKLCSLSRTKKVSFLPMKNPIFSLNESENPGSDYATRIAETDRNLDFIREYINRSHKCSR